MKRKSNNRHQSKLDGRRFVNEFRGLRSYPSFKAEINTSAKNATVNSTIILGTHPLYDIADVSHLENLRTALRANAEPASANPSEIKPQPEKRSNRGLPFGWIALLACGFLGIHACTKAHKNS